MAKNPTVKKAQNFRGGRQHAIPSGLVTAENKLPHDLLLLILIRLPVKSLLRFRSVSKSWKVLISGQDFANMHLKQSFFHPKPQGLIWRDELVSEEDIRRKHIFAVDCSKLENSSADTMERLHHPLALPRLKESALIGSCNGLLCLTWSRYNGDAFLVFNPLTRKCFNFSGETSGHDDDLWDYHGFGYDDAHDDYKVVTWGVRRKRCRNRDVPDCTSFDVYSVNKGSWSTIISGLTGLDEVDLFSRGVLVNYALHWILKNSGGRLNIIAFDLRTEEHMLLETPEDHLEEYGDRMELGELNGCLCGIVLHRCEVPHKLDLWIMKEYPVKNSWTKMTIDLPFYEQQIYGGTPVVPMVHVENKNQLILFDREQGFLVCDVVTNKLPKVIKISELYPNSHDEDLNIISSAPIEFRFQGSLVQPSGFDSFDSLWDEQGVAKQIRKQKKKKIRRRKRRRRIRMPGTWG